MNFSKRIFTSGRALRLGVAAAAASAVLVSCNAPVDGDSGGATGVVGIRVVLDRPGNVLGKAAGDTTFSLDSLKIRLTSSSLDTLNYAYAISGDVGSGSVPVTIKYFTLKALKTWKAKIVSIDTTLGSPNSTDTIHVDSVTFTVLPADTNLISPRSARPT